MNKCTHICSIYSVKTGALLVTKTNLYHPSTKHVSLHAEERAVHKLTKMIKSRLISDKCISKGVHILSYRVSTKTHKLGNGKPCQNCMRIMMKQSHIIKYIQWSDNSGNILDEVRLSDIDINQHQMSSGYKWMEKNKGRL